MSAAGKLQSSGTITTIDLFVEPSSTGKYLNLASACSKHFLAKPECDSVECLQNPADPSHMRIALAYKTGQEWFYKMRETEWFRDFQKNVKPLWVKPRKSSLNDPTWIVMKWEFFVQPPFNISIGFPGTTLESTH